MDVTIIEIWRDAADDQGVEVLRGDEEFPLIQYTAMRYQPLIADACAPQELERDDDRITQGVEESEK